MLRRTPLSLAALTLLTALFVASIGSEQDASTAEPTLPTDLAAHCDAIESLSTCLEYPTRAEAEADCVSFDGTVGDGACPTGSLSGSCLVDGKVRHYYTSGGMPNDADYAGRHCRNALAGRFLGAQPSATPE